MNKLALTHPVLPIAAHMLAILHRIDADAEVGAGAGNTGEIDTELEEQLQAIESNLFQNVDDYVAVIRMIQSYADECRDEAERIFARARSWSNKAAWLKGRILSTLLAIGEKKIKTARNTVSVCGNGGVQRLILPERIESIPDEYLTSRTVIEPDNELIRKKLEAGEKLEFASLAERGVHLKIS